MSDSATTLRPLSGAEEFDRRMRSIAQSSNAHSDAMAELARLVGHHDPFAGAREAEEPPVGESHPALDAGEKPGAPAEPAVVHAVAEPEPWERIVPRYPSISVREEPTPDEWAHGLDEDDGPVGPPPVTAVREPLPVAEPDSSRRTLTVLVAVAVLTAGGIGASFMARSSGGSALATTTAPPTIMAAAGPAKIQPEPPAAGADASSEPSTLLDKAAGDGTATAKVVNSVEQPVDLSQAIKPAPAGGGDDLVPPRPGSFPEPRKVRTVMVRPDGSVVADAAPSAAATPADVMASEDAQQARLAFDPKTALPPTPTERQPSAVEAAITATAAPPAATEPDPVPRTASGKTTNRATARPAASTSQDAAAQGRSTVSTPKAKPPAGHAAAKPKPKPPAPPVAASDADGGVGAPVQVAAADPAPAAAASDATPTASVSPGGSGGAFAIQLGAAPSQAEGEAAATRLGQKYAADLNGSKPSIRKAQANGKTVYRIRVGNLSQDEAKALCAKVQAGGGGCFVARN